VLIPRDEPTLDDELVSFPPNSPRAHRARQPSCARSAVASSFSMAVRVPLMWPAALSVRTRSVTSPSQQRSVASARPWKLGAILARKSSARLQLLKQRKSGSYPACLAGAPQQRSSLPSVLSASATPERSPQVRP